MSAINLVNLINHSEQEFKFIHGLNKRREALHKVTKGSEVIDIHKKNLKMPGGYADFDIQIKLKRNRKPTHIERKRRKLKNLK